MSCLLDTHRDAKEAHRKGGEGALNSEAATRIAIVGVGNVLMGDEGVGVHVAERLKSTELPAGVILLEGGTHFWGDETELDGAQKLIIIDAVVGGGAPGTIYRFGIEDLEDEAQDVKLSCHDVGLIEKLHMIQLGGRKPEEVVIIGVEPARVAWNTDLSEDVEARIPEIIESVMAEIAC